MKKTRFVATIAVLATLSACGTSSKVTEAMIAAHASQQAQPTLALKCPAGCEMAYIDPRDRQQFKAPTNGWDAILGIGQTTVGLVQASVVPIALGAVAIKGMQQMAGTKSADISNATTVTTTTNTGPVTTNTRGDVQANRSETTTTTGATTTSTVGANSGSNSGNSGRIAGSTMADSTSTPTVVNQPSPVVVTQPAPVVVTQPAPVVVVPVAPGASGSGK